MSIIDQDKQALLRDLVEWIRRAEDAEAETMIVQVDVLRRCRAALSALPAEPKQRQRLIEAAVDAFRGEYNTITQYNLINATQAWLASNQNAHASIAGSRTAASVAERAHHEDVGRGEHGHPAAEPKINAHASTAEKSSAPLQEGVGQGEHGHRKWPGECFWADCNKEAIYCEGHAREFVDPLGRLAAPPEQRRVKCYYELGCVTPTMCVDKCDGKADLSGGSVGGAAAPRKTVT